jgi:hypothetical protein
MCGRWKIHEVYIYKCKLNANIQILKNNVRVLENLQSLYVQMLLKNEYSDSLNQGACAGKSMWYIYTNVS